MSEIDDTISYLEALWNRAAAAMNASDFPVAKTLYCAIIPLMERIQTAPEIDAALLREDFANAYCDYSYCLLMTDEGHVNPAVHAMLQALDFGSQFPPMINNLLYCMGQVNLLMRAGIKRLPDSERNRKLVRCQNDGYDLLKTPYPRGSSGRNWAGARNCYSAAVALAPKLPECHHGLGLAYYGLDQDDAAIKEWRDVKALAPDYDFEVRWRFEIAS